MQSTITIRKRNGKEEQLNLEKIHSVVEFAVEGLHNVSASEIELRAELQFYNKMTTAEIQETLIKSAAELITEETPNYQIAAARLISFDLRKMAYGQFEPPPLKSIVEKNVAEGFYISGLLEAYTDDEWDYFNRIIKHERDDLFTFCGMEQFRSKYLVKNKVTGAFFETPQIAFFLISATAFMNETKNRLRLVKEFYNALSLFDITLPSAVIAGLRTSVKQFSNCTLIDVGDSLDSINASASAIVKYASKRAGIGINVGRLRGIGSKIRNGEVVHTGIVPFIKYLIAALKACNQGGLRNSSATITIPIWHYEFQDVIVLKNNKGTEDTRARSADYCIQFNKLFLERLIGGKDISLFSPSEVPDLYELFFTNNDEFAKLYEKYEKDKSIRRKTISAIDAFTLFITERKETGRIYAQFVDHTNSHGAYDPTKAAIYMTNLCVEVTQPTKPLSNIFDEEGMISLCTLGGYNLGNIKQPADFERIAVLLVRFLDNVLSYQDYLIPAAKTSTMTYRNLGIGLNNLAYFLAKHNYKYSQDDAAEFLQPFFEAYSYYTIKASIELAKERGACPGLANTKWAKGIMPIDTYKKDFDKEVPNNLALDWQLLRKDLLEFGIRNANLLSQMPMETNSQLSNSTNGIEPPRALVSIKNSKDGVLKQVVPEIHRLKNKYELLWDQKSPRGYLKIAATLNKFIDQAISTNVSYNPQFYENNEIPMSELLADFIYSYQLGLKTLYYNNIFDGAGEIAIPDTLESLPEDNILNESPCEDCTL